MTYDLIILGGGPAGCAAAVYSARKELKTAMITVSFGGQSIDSPLIFNWIGTKEISGYDLAKDLENHVRANAGKFLEVFDGEKIAELKKDGEFWKIKTESGKEFESKSVLVTTGGSRKKLEVPGAEEFEGRGIVYCASCDGPLYSGKDVVVIGGGNAGFESAAQVLAYAKSVTLLSRGDFKADAITVEAVLKDPKMKAMKNTIPTFVKGEKLVTELGIKNTETGEETSLPVQGIFVEIGNIPNTKFIVDNIDKDEWGRINVDPKTGRSSEDGLWAAGDCTNTLFHQNNIAAGEGVRALEDIYLWLKTKK